MLTYTPSTRTPGSTEVLGMLENQPVMLFPTGTLLVGGLWINAQALPHVESAKDGSEWATLLEQAKINNEVWTEWFRNSKAEQKHGHSE